ncbi:glycosyl hydrolase family 47 [Colletotrichum incanum]|uniref:Glycosyl hydrolase family 47 n=1 Tax=Colletotrichum incanum TaxID=1573173 RepID=A0A166RQ94_COLIC|nr:glycosyl hydrolase family 47 [Colletotrichum incanum]
MYKTIYEAAITPAIKHNLFRPMTPGSDDTLIAGQTHSRKSGSGTIRIELEPPDQHLVCFKGALMALGGKLFTHPDRFSLERNLVDGCVYTYRS